MTDRIAEALNSLAEHAPRDPDLALRARRRSRRRRLNVVSPAAAVLTVVAVLTGVWLSRPPVLVEPAAPPASACGPLHTEMLPSWARTGFTGDSYPPFALSTGGNVVAVLFGGRLTVPAGNNPTNKVLWVTKELPLPSDTLVITGRLEGTDRTFVVDTGTSPGPSTVDMPAAGCWLLDLAWGEHRDTMNLRWEPAG